MPGLPGVPAWEQTKLVKRGYEAVQEIDWGKAASQDDGLD